MKMKWYKKALLTLGIGIATTGSGKAQEIATSLEQNGEKIENITGTYLNTPDRTDLYILETDLNVQDRANLLKFKTLVNRIAALPEIEISEMTDSEGRKFVDEANRWHSNRKISQDGRPLYTTTTTVYDNDKVVRISYNHSTAKFEDHAGNELSSEEFAEKQLDILPASQEKLVALKQKLLLERVKKKSE